jgi:hypothetical protein
MNASTYAMGRYVAGVLLAAVLLAGCSGLRPYPNNLEKNLVIRTETDSGSIFSKVRAEVDIFRVKADCKTEYQGTVKLNGPSIKVGIPPDRLSYIVFVFSNSSFLASSRSTMSHETLLKTRAGFSYDIRVSYIDDIYNLTITEKHPRKPKGREIDIRDISACKAL